MDYATLPSTYYRTEVGFQIILWTQISSNLEEKFNVRKKKILSKKKNNSQKYLYDIPEKVAESNCIY